MKYFELEKEEKEILKEFDEGNFVALNKNESEKYKEYAKATLSKTKNINLRLTEKDLQKVKIQAAMKGMPYQTLMSSLIHQYVNNRIKTKAV